MKKIVKYTKVRYTCNMKYTFLGMLIIISTAIYAQGLDFSIDVNDYTVSQNDLITLTFSVSNISENNIFFLKGFPYLEIIISNENTGITNKIIINNRYYFADKDGEWMSCSREPKYCSWTNIPSGGRYDYPVVFLTSTNIKETDYHELKRNRTVRRYLKNGGKLSDLYISWNRGYIFQETGKYSLYATYSNMTDYYIGDKDNTTPIQVNPLLGDIIDISRLSLKILLNAWKGSVNKELKRYIIIKPERQCFFSRIFKKKKG